MAQRSAKNSKKSHTSHNIRPTSGKVLLALFNILQSSGLIAGSRLLDLFAGTGEVSLAALAHGAAFALAVESDRTMAAAISRRFASLSSASRPGSASVMTGDVRRILPKLARLTKEGEAEAAQKFDVVFADPPYCLGWGETLPRLVEENFSVLSEGGVFVFEHSTREEPAKMSSSTFTRDDRIYGETVLSFYWANKQGAGEAREEDVF